MIVSFVGRERFLHFGDEIKEHRVLNVDVAVTDGELLVPLGQIEVVVHSSEFAATPAASSALERLTLTGFRVKPQRFDPRQLPAERSTTVDQLGCRKAREIS